MTHSRFTLGLVPVSAFALAALMLVCPSCGGGTGTDGAATLNDMTMPAPDMSTGMVDPLVGTWKSSETSGGDTSVLTITLKADKTATSSAVVTSTGTGCIQDVELTNTWSTSGMMLSITPTAGTTQTTACTDTTANKAQMPASGPDLMALTGTYTVVGNLLTISMGGQSMMFTRQ